MHDSPPDGNRLSSGCQEANLSLTKRSQLTHVRSISSQVSVSGQYAAESSERRDGAEGDSAYLREVADYKTLGLRAWGRQLPNGSLAADLDPTPSC